MNRISYKYLLPILAAFMVSCSDDEMGPVLGQPDTFVAPVLKNGPSTEVIPITLENAGEDFEEFRWDKAQYGIQLGVDYILQMADDEEFSNPKTVATSTSDSVVVGNRRFNDVALSLGLPSDEEITVYLRVGSTITGVGSDTLYSNIINRSIIAFRSSECGNFCTMGLVGSATPGGWDVDTDMRLADIERIDKATWTVVLYLEGGEKVKFRANDDWADDWGGSDFPSGIAEYKGPDIAIPESGYYRVVFNDETLAYTFTLLTVPTFSTIGILGDATSGGWSDDIDLAQDTDNGHIWSGVITLEDGEVKFRADDDWTDSWGSTTFPSGHGVAGGPNIPVKAGTYYVQFNLATGEYAFMRQSYSEPFALIGILGDATAGGWDEDHDLIQNPANPYWWSKLVTLSSGEAKFRADDDWTDNWGAVDFPKGVGIPGGPNIPVQEGTYFVSFHTGTGEYYLLK